MPPEHWIYTIPLRLRSLFRSVRADEELDDELRDHLERKTEEYVAKGMAPEEAPWRARLDLGGVEKVKEAGAARPGGRGEGKGGMPRSARSELDSRPHSGFALRSAHVAQVSRLHRGRHSYPGSRRGRKHRHLQPR